MTEEPQYTVRKIGYSMPISDELAMEYGLIPDTRPPAPPPSWRQRMRWQLQRAVRPVRLRLAARIGGVSRTELEEITWL